MESHDNPETPPETLPPNEQLPPQSHQDQQDKPHAQKAAPKTGIVSKFVRRWTLSMPLKLALSSIAILILLGGGGAVYWHNTKTTTAPKTTQQNTTANSTATTQATTTQTISDIDVGTIALLEDAKQLPDLKLFANPKALANDTSSTTATIKYYQIGTTSTGKAYIIASLEFDQGPYYELTVVEKDQATYYLSTNSLDQYDESLVKSGDAQKAINSNVTLAAITSKGLDLPVSMSMPNGASLTSIAINPEGGPSYDFLPNGLNSLIDLAYGSGSTVKQIGSGAAGVSVYEITGSNNDSIQDHSIYAALKHVFAQPFALHTPLSALSFDHYATPANDITWMSGQQNTANDYGYYGSGCSAGGRYTTSPDLSAQNLTKIGTASDGSAIYAIPASSTVFKAYFSDYTAIQSSITNKAYQNLTQADLENLHAMVASPNALGELVLYERYSIDAPGGCGKPVIYLYPQQTTDISVRVGAQVVKSDPTYPAAMGWQHVLAQPSGQLIYRGKIYPSLYWEGYGNGIYPTISNGTVVPTFLARATIQQQLLAQGLNIKEVTDFLAFWGNKLPATPYTRLTWLTTQQMNTLAPLAITPRPDTLIRVFLDFQGLDQPEQLTPQKFTAPARTGFTVVEWGGLLRGGIR